MAAIFPDPGEITEISRWLGRLNKNYGHPKAKTFNAQHSILKGAQFLPVFDVECAL
jgi:hypothetical protein